MEGMRKPRDEPTLFPGDRPNANYGPRITRHANQVALDLNLSRGDATTVISRNFSLCNAVIVGNRASDVIDYWKENE